MDFTTHKENAVIGTPGVSLGCPAAPWLDPSLEPDPPEVKACDDDLDDDDDDDDDWDDEDDDDEEYDTGSDYEDPEPDDDEDDEDWDDDDDDDW